MKLTPFNPEPDLYPISFDERHCPIVATLKDAGLPSKPHVGCFLWDRNELIEVGSLFPGRIYSILNLGHFLHPFGTVQNIVEKVIWLPTWHQARLLCAQFGVDQGNVSNFWGSSGEIRPRDELIGLYEIPLRALRRDGVPT